MNAVAKYHAPRKFSDLSSALSYRIYGELRGTHMKWVPSSSCHDYVVAGGYNLANVGHKAHVWCAGYTKSYGPSSRPQKIYSVRGPLSQARAKQHMNLSVPCAGDPILLISDMHDIPEVDSKPCFFGKSDKSFLNFTKDRNSRCVTINDSLDTILVSIKNASYVVTDLLEGLVISDSFCVKSAFVTNDCVPFTVRDYLGNFGTSGRDTIVLQDIATCDGYSLRYRNTAKLKSTLVATLPDV